jgi:hypothetical protein
MQLVLLLQLTPVAAVVPKRTLVALLAVLKFVPVIVTAVPPAVLPPFGLSAVTVGRAGALAV